MAYNPYAQYKQQAVTTFTPGEMLSALYDGAILNLNKAKLAIDNCDIAEANAQLTKAQKIVRYLNATLDMKYPISIQLRQLYTFMDEKIIEANIKKVNQPIDDVLPLLNELKVTFNEADKLARQQG